MEGFDGAEGPGVGLPVEVAEREAGDEAGGEEFVDVVRVEVLDWRGQHVLAVSNRRREGGGRRAEVPVTLEVENCCSMANSC